MNIFPVSHNTGAPVAPSAVRQVSDCARASLLIEEAKNASFVKRMAHYRDVALAALAGPTCCDVHGNNCNQGDDCPLRGGK